MRRLSALALVLVAACATAGGDDVPIDPDADRPDGDPTRPDAPAIDAAPPDANPIDAAPMAVTLSQSTNVTTIVDGNSAACNQGNLTRENSYYRAFPLAGSGISGQFTATRVDVGIEQADSLTGSQAIQVRLHTLTGTMEAGTMTLLHGQNVTVADQVLSVLPVTLTSPVVVPAGSTLVVEVFVPDGLAAENVFFIGSNALGQTADPYIKAATCDIPTPQTFASLAFPQTHVVLTVSGTTP